MFNIRNLPIVRQYVKFITTCTNMDRDKKQRAEYDLLQMRKIIQYKKALINCLYSPSGEKILRLPTGDIQWTKLIAPRLPISFTVKLFLQSCTVKQYGKSLL